MTYCIRARHRVNTKKRGVPGLRGRGAKNDLGSPKKEEKKINRSYFQRVEITRGCLALVTLPDLHIILHLHLHLRDVLSFFSLSFAPTLFLSLFNTQSLLCPPSLSLPLFLTLEEQTSASKREKKQRKETKYVLHSYTMKRMDGQADRHFHCLAASSEEAFTL